jgi:hypothetical protein
MANNFKTYLAASKKDNGLYKIGRSTKPEERVYVLSANLVHIIDTDIERYLHNIYDHKRVEGEYFLLSKQDVNDIINIDLDKINPDDLIKETVNVNVKLSAEANKVIHSYQTEYMKKNGMTITKAEAVNKIIEAHGK